MRKLVLLVCISILLVACSNKTNNEANEEPVEVVDNDSGQTDDQSNESEGTFANINPFTGIGTNNSIDHRAIGVMINNHTDARPQSGLSQADIVFEILAEGMITRFLAIFHSEQPEIVGPVRSAREYYFDLANRYGALYVYHGAAEFVNEMLDNRGIDHLDGSIYDNDGKLFKRESFRVAPHNSYLLMNNVYEVANDIGYEITNKHTSLPFLSDKEVASINGEEAKHIEIVYSKSPMEIVEYEYNPETENYKRYNDRELTEELHTGEPITVDNIFIIETYHEVIDKAGRRSIDFYAGGNAYLIQKGKAQKLEWENRDGYLVPVKDGEVVGFVPGKTWINVVPTDPGMNNSVIISGQ
ncbi:DUF3048 domain-containing protein [Ornithinibacillus halotolerans]|uniref:Lipoprotein YerB n=1 Tax=Ornithinibacillus halotolerans TaxID=1274357 RepID=A0A916RYJ5_9BACI|nr:DUF3048 domain-containing protein [Ornithinibacillus halotolerans]GGA75603.1 putative lipoprotein YerB [Ornithinibacillus halotolerans]